MTRSQQPVFLLNDTTNAESDAMTSPRHPCFDPHARRDHSRVHLPVAPRCNVQCQFCNRRFDCVNESRPGVSAAVLRPAQAAWYVDQLRQRDPSLSVVGIAGPGDPFANVDETLETLRRVRRRQPDLLLCLSTNGLGLPPHVDTIADLGVNHVTVTVNAIDPVIAGRIYRWIRDGDTVLRGEAAGRRICIRQAAAVRALVRRGITVKINCICIPGVNDHHVEDVAQAMKELGADRFNLMPLQPVAGTGFGTIVAPDHQHMRELRHAAARHLPQMRHCQRCRADAVGRLGEGPDTSTTNLLKEASSMSSASCETRPHVAVCSREGVLVNQHLGHAEKILIYAAEADCFRLVDVRPAPSAGLGDARWQDLVELLGDCRAVVAAAAGPTPEQHLGAAGVTIRCTEGLIEDALELVFADRADELQPPSCNGPGGGCSAGSCSGAGNACA